MGQNLFFLLDDSFNFEKFEILVLDFLGHKKLIIKIAPYLLENTVGPYILFSDIFAFDNARKNTRKFFIPWKECFFSKICVFNNPLVLKKQPYYFLINCQNSFLARINCCLRFVTLDNLRKYGAITFVHGNFCFFFKSLCFQQPPRA